MNDLKFRSEPPPSEPEDLKPLEFDLVVWRTTKDQDPVEEEHSFACLPRSEVSGHRINTVLLSTADGDIAAAASAWRFFETVMQPEDLTRLDGLLNERDVYVDPGVLVEASASLFTEYAGRPTRPQRRSAPGQKGRARTSTARRS